jgi:phage baseplate assembly protein W
MATTSRADKFTQTQKKQVLFSDFLDNFDRVPFNNQLAKVTNENAVRQSITNLVLTNYGERLFQPNVGGNVNDSLFEFADAITAQNLTYDIRTTIQNFEPRANLLNVVVYPSPDKNSFVVNIVFSIINSTTPVNINLTVSRAR